MALASPLASTLPLCHTLGNEGGGGQDPAIERPLATVSVSDHWPRFCSSAGIHDAGLAAIPAILTLALIRKWRAIAAGRDIKN